MKNYSPRYTVKLVRENLVQYGKLDNSNKAEELAFAALRDEPSEVFSVIMLDTQLNIIGITEVTKGILDASLVHPREVFRAPILSNAARIILVHNHPSGETKPSEADFMVTAKMYKCGEMLGINVMDHIIVGDEPLSMATHYGNWNCKYPA